MADISDRLFAEAIQEKMCSICRTGKPVDLFHRNKNMKDGRTSACKACAKEAREVGAKSTFICERCSESHNKKNKGSQRYCEDCAAEVRRERDRARRPKTKVGFQKICERCDEAFAYKGGKQVVCQVCVKVVNAERGRAWAEANRDAVRANAKRYNDARRATPSGHLEWTIRASVKRAIAKETKAGRRTFELLGYTVDDLKTHLERQFLPGMTWENYGEWHVDHRVPLASFEYQTPDCDEFKSAWAITNLQPLWAKDNLSKGSRRTVLL